MTTDGNMEGFVEPVSDEGMTVLPEIEIVETVRDLEPSMTSKYQLNPY